MAFHELATNAARYGALSVADGRVDLSWALREIGGRRKVFLEWIERDGPPVRPPSRQGFGLTLLSKVLPMQVDAEVTVNFAPQGLQCRIAAPLIERRFVPEY